METQSQSSKLNDERNNNDQPVDRPTRLRIVNSQDQNQLVNTEEDPDPDDSDLDEVEYEDQLEDEMIDEDLDEEDEDEPGTANRGRKKTEKD